MKKQPDQTPECGLGRALAVIKGKWKPSLIWELHQRPIRFGELKRRLPGITEKVLFEQLRQLEVDGIVHREVYDELPARVEYSLTTFGAGLNAAVHELAEWGKRLPSPTSAVAERPPLPEGVIRVSRGVRLHDSTS
ncbi:winged helix-turn-helix transcriptional regulator [Caldimonas brevitalea]|uniref:Transcriptional regulator, HxlR family n=1 Tax=Caldimonas brevitalea TaxID=413882 RepID=A0A0G3BZE7_9BURK|nr:helix-turn-helix domain-containing protein [Caldimonas brevitalea]AKJ31905.1 transcriptional regulator, HxlR family [Caldimonas brevitalea]